MNLINTREQKGITLISLVVIIIVTLILAGISVAILSGNNGMIIKSAEAREETQIGDDIERIRASYSTVTMNKLKKADGRKYTVTAEELQEQILADMHETEGVTVTGDDFKADEKRELQGEFTVEMPSGYTYTINAKGDTKLKGSEEEEPTTETSPTATTETTTSPSAEASPSSSPADD